MTYEKDIPNPANFPWIVYSGPDDNYVVLHCTDPVPEGFKFKARFTCGSAAYWFIRSDFHIFYIVYDTKEHRYFMDTSQDIVINDERYQLYGLYFDADQAEKAVNQCNSGSFCRPWTKNLKTVAK
jgi:hypothetical protein